MTLRPKFTKSQIKTWLRKRTDIKPVVYNSIFIVYFRFSEFSFQTDLAFEITEPLGLVIEFD